MVSRSVSASTPSLSLADWRAIETRKPQLDQKGNGVTGLSSQRCHTLPHLRAKPRPGQADAARTPSCLFLSRTSHARFWPSHRTTARDCWRSVRKRVGTRYARCRCDNKRDGTDTWHIGGAKLKIGAFFSSRDVCRERRAMSMRMLATMCRECESVYAHWKQAVTPSTPCSARSSKSWFLARSSLRRWFHLRARTPLGQRIPDRSQNDIRVRTSRCRRRASPEP